MVKGYCIKCRREQEIKNAIFGKTIKGMGIVKGKCPICNTNMSRFRAYPDGVEVSEKFIQKSDEERLLKKPEERLIKKTPEEKPKNNEIEELNKKILELQGQKQEKERILKFIEDVERNELLRKKGLNIVNTHQNKIIDKSLYRFLMFFLILFGISILIFGYLIYTEKLKSDLNCAPVSVCSDIPECPIIPSCPNISCITSCPNISCPQQIVNVSNICNGA